MTGRPQAFQCLWLTFAACLLHPPSFWPFLATQLKVVWNWLHWTIELPFVENYITILSLNVCESYVYALSLLYSCTWASHLRKLALHWYGYVFSIFWSQLHNPGSQPAELKRCWYNYVIYVGPCTKLSTLCGWPQVLSKNQAKMVSWNWPWIQRISVSFVVPQVVVAKLELITV